MLDFWSFDYLSLADPVIFRWRRLTRYSVGNGTREGRREARREVQDWRVDWKSHMDRVRSGNDGGPGVLVAAAVCLGRLVFYLVLVSYGTFLGFVLSCKR